MVNKMNTKTHLEQPSTIIYIKTPLNLAVIKEKLAWRERSSSACGRTAKMGPAWTPVGGSSRVWEQTQRRLSSVFPSSVPSRMVGPRERPPRWSYTRERRKERKGNRGTTTFQLQVENVTIVVYLCKFNADLSVCIYISSCAYRVPVSSSRGRIWSDMWQSASVSESCCVLWSP